MFAYVGARSADLAMEEGMQVGLFRVIGALCQWTSRCNYTPLRCLYKMCVGYILTS